MTTYLNTTTQPTSLFVDFSDLNVNKTKLNQLNFSAYIDSSGSTSGSIMKNQITTYKKLQEYCKITKVVSWASSSSLLPSVNINQLTSSGGTDPSCFVRYWDNESAVIIFTDGQISVSDMERFKTNIQLKVNNIPIIIMLSLNSIDQRGYTISDLKRQVGIDMSIPETFLSLSNDVVIAITDGVRTKVLMSKGEFVVFESNQLDENSVLSYLPDFDYKLLGKLELMAGLPSNFIKLEGYDKYLDLNNIATSSEMNIDVLEKLCSRAILPKLNISLINMVLERLYKQHTANPELEQLRNELYQISASTDAGSEKHQQLINRYNQIRLLSHSIGSKDVLNRITKLRVYINEYLKDKTSFTYGSNRAIRATDIDVSDLDNFGRCKKIECPIMMTEDDACIVFSKPEEHNYVEVFTSDYYMESPFEFGKALSKLVQPGIFGREMAENMSQNPYTREDVIGFVPLSESPAVIMRHMSKLFGGNKELWHFLRGFVSMLAYVSDFEWANKPLFTSLMTQLCLKYKVSDDLKASDTKIPLGDALKNVLTNYSVHLRDRMYWDILAIIKICDMVYPEFTYNKVKVMGLAQVVNKFTYYINKHKQSEDMTPYVMKVDDYGHYLDYTKGLDGLMAQLFWYDRDGEYRQYKTQLALDKALSDKRFGKYLIMAFNGEEFDDSFLNCALPEPDHTNIHYQSITNADKWTTQGLSEHTCIYCKETFCSGEEKIQHLKNVWGQYFYNGHLTVKKAIAEIGINAGEKEIFMLTKEKLFRAYGPYAKVLHTQHTKDKLLQFINRFKEVYERDGRLDFLPQTQNSSVTMNRTVSV
jgi:hypothetical protein